MNLLKYRCKNNYLNVLILGIFTALIIFLPFIILDKGMFLYYGDFNVQQIPFYMTSHDAVRNGAMGWSWVTDLGANFIGSYSFYTLGSPFFWITLLFPNAALPYLMAPLLILKFGLTCVTGYAFISRFTMYKNTAIIGALLYAFCGFNIYNIFFNHFNEVALVFPLLLIGLEELVLNNRRGGFALVVALCALVNYYFFFGQVIFVIFYFLIRCLDKTFTVNLKKFFLIAFEAVLGLLLSAILLLPAIFAITGNTRLTSMLNGYNLLIFSDAQRYGQILSSFFFPPDIPARPNFFPDSNAKWSSVSMFLPLFSMTAVIAFFKGTKKHWAKTLVIISIIFAFIPMTNAMFSAMNSSYYARWFYMPILIMAMVSCIALEKYNKHMKFGIIVTASFVAAFALIGILPKKADGGIEFFKMPKSPDRFWVYVAVAVIGLLVTGLLVVLTRKHKHFMKTAVIGIMCVSILYSTYMIYVGRSIGDGYNKIAGQALAGREQLKLEGDEFFRLDTYGETDNLGMFWNKPSINAFHSIVPDGVTDYYVSMGEKRTVASRPTPEYIGVRALTSTKYSFMNEKSTEKPLLGFDYYDTQLGYKIYKNNYFVPMGFTYNKLITQEQAENCNDKKLDRLLLKGILLDQDVYEKNTDILETLDIAASNPMNFTDEEYFIDCEALNTNTVTDFEYDSYGFSSKITTPKENLIFFSVPYDKGWSASVNGSEVEIYQANYGFMAVRVPQGSSVINFEYETPGLKVGIIVTIISAVIFIAYLMLINWLRKKGKACKYDRYAHMRVIDNPVNLVAKDAYIAKLIKRRPQQEQLPPATVSSKETSDEPLNQIDKSKTQD